MDSVSLWELDYEEKCSNSESGELSGESEESVSGDTDEENDDSSRAVMTVNRNKFRNKKKAYKYKVGEP